MPKYYLDSQLINMYYNQPLGFQEDPDISTIKHYISIINSFINVQKLHQLESLHYYMYQVFILDYTQMIKNIIDSPDFIYNSIITNEITTYNEEKVKLIEAQKNIKLLENENKKCLLAKDKYKTLILANMTQIFPTEILENIAYQLTSKKRSAKKQPTNWYNFCKQRKNANLNYKDNSEIWKSLNYATKNKYKNPYYKHF